jgi:CheY-like chemotaxis protein
MTSGTLGTRPTAGTASRVGNGPSVLVCEDQEPTRRMITRILERNGYTVLQARSGADALAVLRGSPSPIDLLLSDVVMPHMSGIELGRRVDDGYPQTKVLYMSGYSNNVLSSREAGGPYLAVIPKPFTSDELLAAVRAALDD